MARFLLRRISDVIEDEKVTQDSRSHAYMEDLMHTCEQVDASLVFVV